MKKFHKRAAVFLTAATLAGLPAGAFFYFWVFIGPLTEKEL